MNERRIADLYESLSAARRCLMKRLRRYTHDRKVSNLEESLKRLDAMQECIDKIRAEISSEITRRAEIGF